VPDLPHGTVTLVFTDVEGSTQVVHRLDQRYEQVLADHRRLLHEAVAAAEGHVVDHRGDEFFMVFQATLRSSPPLAEDSAACA
jgi:class 3 adenylate cyclase